MGPFTYSLSLYGKMIADSTRMAAYSEALRRAVRPGSVVLDIGAGAGILSLLACQAGASKVYAIEPASAIDVGRELAAANGYRDRIEFVQGVSTEVTLPQRCDVIVSDLRGILPLFQRHIPSIADARQRFLTEGGVLIPQCDTIWAAVVEAPILYQEYLIWNEDVYGIDLRYARQFAVNEWKKVYVSSERLLVTPERWMTLDYTAAAETDVKGTLTWTAARDGTACGLVVWFESTLFDGVTFSTGPDAPETIYGMAFFPWQTPVALAAGDAIAVHLSAELVGQEYLWRWDSRVLGQTGRQKADFHQTTFFDRPLSPAQLRKRSAIYTPQVSRKGRVIHLALGLMSERLSQGDIAHRLLGAFPDEFSRWEEALVYVADLAENYAV